MPDFFRENCIFLGNVARLFSLRDLPGLFLGKHARFFWLPSEFQKQISVLSYPVFEMVSLWRRKDDNLFNGPTCRLVNYCLSSVISRIDCLQNRTVLLSQWKSKAIISAGEIFCHNNKAHYAMVFPFATCIVHSREMLPTTYQWGREYSKCENIHNPAIFPDPLLVIKLKSPPKCSEVSHFLLGNLTFSRLTDSSFQGPMNNDHHILHFFVFFFCDTCDHQLTGSNI